MKDEKPKTLSEYVNGLAKDPRNQVICGKCKESFFYQLTINGKCLRCQKIPHFENKKNES